MAEKLDEKEIKYLIDNGEFSENVIGRGKTAVIMTQGWCPQWQAMNQFLDEIDGAKIYVYEYDPDSDFVEFKEKKFNNDQIPYIRYYKDSKFLGESNYVDKQGFIRSLD